MKKSLIPAKHAVIKQAIVPEHRALNAILAKSLFRSGAIGLKPPIWIPIEEKFANPQRAYADITSERTYNINMIINKNNLIAW